MACRIGITTDPERRKSEWKRKHPTLRDWQILERHSTKKAAQDAEDRLASKHGCDSKEGGRPPENEKATLWYVYGFNY